MRITRLRIENFRRFRAPVEITGLDAGLNLFAAPNESGKSTIAAAIRAAFLERHKTGTLDQLRPWSDPGASPAVEIDFEFEGTSYALAKSFMGRKRCDLTIGRATLEGAEAEERLAELVGCRLADKGGARAETLGIPGLLWIEQGTSQDLDTPLSNAQDRLQAALRQQFSGIATTGGDTLMERVAAARTDLVTAKTGKPTGAYAEAVARRDGLCEERDELARKIQDSRERVDRLDRLVRDAAELERTQPWEALRRQEREAEERLREARMIAGQRDSAAQAAKAAQDKVRILTGNLDGYAREEKDTAQRVRDLATAKEAAAQARATLARIEEAFRLADAAAKATRDALGRAMDAQTRRDAQTRFTAAETALRQAGAALEAAEAQQRRIVELKTESARIAIEPKLLRKIEKLGGELAENHLRRDTIATGLAFELVPGKTIRIGDTILTGSSQITVATEVTVELPELGTMTVRPGGADLPALAAQIATQESELRALLDRAGAADIEALRERDRRDQALRRDIATAEQLLAVHAPEGLAALQTDVATKRTERDEAAAGLERLPAIDPAVPEAPQLKAAAEAEQAAREDLDAVSSARNDASQKAASAVAKAAQISQELEKAQAALAAPERAAQKARVETDLATARSDETTATGRLAAAEARLAELDLPAIENDIRRFGDSAKAAETQRQTLRDEIRDLRTILTTAGAAGLEERQAETLRDLAGAERRVGEFAQRVAALDLILELMREKRAALSRRILAPLQQRLDRYLRLALPGLAVELDETLAPAHVRRELPGAGGQGGGFGEYSVGAREQLGILLRLAYADLLKEAGRPTLVILDDALVHTDRDRLAGMKRALYDAATRHQFLIFTCHPQAWNDLGVAARPLPG
jgi:hypothetical protein